MEATVLWSEFPNVDNDTKWQAIRVHRDRLLERSAWIHHPDIPLTASQLIQWQDYREALFVIETTQTNPDLVVFPEEPITVLNPTAPAYVQAEILRRAADQEMATVGNGWPSYTKEQALDWVQTNIGTPLSAPIPANPMSSAQIRATFVAIVGILDMFRIMNIAMIKMIIAIRNKTFNKQS